MAVGVSQDEQHARSAFGATFGVVEDEAHNWFTDKRWTVVDTVHGLTIWKHGSANRESYAVLPTNRVPVGCHGPYASLATANGARTRINNGNQLLQLDDLSSEIRAEEPPATAQRFADLPKRRGRRSPGAGATPRGVLRLTDKGYLALGWVKGADGAWGPPQPV